MISATMLYVIILTALGSRFTEAGSAICPDGVKQFKCFNNPCSTASCPAFDSATCVPNYCGGCNADFYVDNKKVDCGLQVKTTGYAICPDGMKQFKCFNNPCSTASCPAFDSATCVPNYCGGCKADFYVGNKKVDCAVCPDGVKQFKCFNNPCSTASCPAFDSATCVPNYCGGCKADFYIDNKKVDCGLQVKTAGNECPGGIRRSNCKVDPCVYASCPAFESATCKANYCGGCKADFYVDDKRVDCV